ncbi:MAG TPA: hypothetical protein VKG24_22035 [Pseudolabrys sp.]|jgi:hypothetical protein|nr:hypothetical protein [Pseudolabrys sp.]
MSVLSNHLVKNDEQCSSDKAVVLIVFAFLVCASFSAVLLTPIPAMVDYLNHLARMYVLASDGMPGANPYYHAAWALYPNLSMDLLVPQLARAFNVDTASRIFLLLSQGLVISGALALERIVKGRFEIAGFVAVMFLYSLPFSWGFLNFEFGVGLSLWGIAFMLLVMELPWLVRLSVNAVFVSMLFAAHFFALGIYGATLGICELWRAWDRNAPHSETAFRLALLAVPALALLGAMQLTGGTIGFAETDWFFTFKLLWPFRIMSGYSMTSAATSMVVLTGVIYIAAKHGYLQLETRGLWIAIGFALLYIAIPSRLFGSAFADLRILVAAALVLPAFCTLAMPRRALRAMLAATSTITLVNLAIVLTVWLSYRADYAAMIDSFHQLKAGSTVLVGASGDGDDPPFHDLTEYPMYHAPTLAAAYANAFVPNLFAVVGEQPIQVRPAVRRLAVRIVGPVPVAVLTAIATGNTAPEVPQFIRSWTQDYDYLYLLGPPIANPMPKLLETLVTSRRFVLYRIHRAHQIADPSLEPSYFSLN